MATITISDSENIAIENGTQLPITITISQTTITTGEQYIDGLFVDQRGVPSATIAVGNIIRGIFNNRYIVAEVMALPYTEESNLKFYTDNAK